MTQSGSFATGRSQEILAQLSEVMDASAPAVCRLWIERTFVGRWIEGLTQECSTHLPPGMTRVWVKMFPLEFSTKKKGKGKNGRRTDWQQRFDFSKGKEQAIKLIWVPADTRVCLNPCAVSFGKHKIWIKKSVFVTSLLITKEPSCLSAHINSISERICGLYLNLYFLPKMIWPQLQWLLGLYGMYVQIAFWKDSHLSR